MHLAGDSKARQFFTIGTEILATAAFWNDTLYIAPKGSPMLAYAFDPGIQMFLPALAPAPTSQSAAPYGHPGSTPAVSASGASSNGILWAIDSTNFCTFPAPACGPAVLHAYSAANLMTELWNSAMVGADAAGYAVKFTVPTVANGKVFVPTWDLRRRAERVGIELPVQIEGHAGTTNGHTVDLSAVGARVILTSSGKSQTRELRSGSSYQSQNALELHFGTGPSSKVEAVEIFWPGGLKSSLRDQAADRTITVREPSDVRRNND